MPESVIRSDERVSRVTRTKRQSKDSYNRISGWYDLLEGRWEEAFVDQGLHMLNLREGERVLEIGPGPGKALLALARMAGGSGKVYGIDISAKMLQLCRRRLERAHLLDRAELILGDGAHLPFRPGSFDALFMSFALELFDTTEIPVVLAEGRRVLKDEGRICIVSLSKRGGYRSIVDLYEWGHRALPSLLDCRPIFVRESLQRAEFKALDSACLSLWGLPVEAVLAKKLPLQVATPKLRTPG
jgi:ubiquinone/menaquinone biosynthesis C-methylase UbiE